MTTLAQSAGTHVGGAQRVYGREPELVMVDSVAERLAAGNGSIVVWLGETGIGRSTLLRAATDRISAAVDGVHCINVSGRGVRGGPLAAIGFVIHQLLPSVPAARSEALDRLLRPGADEDPDPAALLQAAVHVVKLAARERPILITLDDGHVAEDGNWSAVSAAAAQLATTRAAVLMTSGLRGSHRAPLTSIGPLWVRRIAPLSAAATVRVVQESVPHFVPRSVAARLGRQLAGNPSAIQDVCSALSRDELLGLDPLPSPLPAAGSAIEKYRDWIARLTPAQFTLVLCAALAVNRNAPAIEAAAGLEISELPGIEGEPWARVRNEQVEFVDPRLPSVVVKAATHRQVTQAQTRLAETTPDPVAALLHRAAVGERLDPAGLDTLTVAADELLDAGDYEGALRAARHALRAMPPGPKRADVALIGGVAAYHETYVGLAATLLHDAVRDSVDPDTRYRALAALALSVAARDGSAPYAVVDAALAPLSAERPDLAASLAALVARIAADSQQSDLARTYLGRAESLATDLLSDEGAAAGSTQGASSARLTAELEHTRRWVGSTRRTRSDRTQMLATVTTTRRVQDLTGWDLAVRQVCLLSRAEDWQPARFALAEVEHRQGRLASRMVAAATAVAGLELHLAVGAVQEAQDIVAAFADLVPLRMPFAGAGLCLVARTLILRDQIDGAQEWLEYARRYAQSTGSPVVLVRIPAELALLAAVRGDAEESARLLGVAVQRASHFGHHGFAELQLDLLEARHLAGLETRTDEVMPVLEFAWGGPEATSTQRALLAAARLLAAPSERLVAAALAAVDAAEWQASPLWAARVMTLAASCLARLSEAEHEEQVQRLAVSDLPRARDEHRRALLQKAFGQFTECGATAQAARATALLAGLDGTPEQSGETASSGAPPRLTPDEQRVAALVAGGASNRQVASTTYVSVRTVELRLTSIYRKLGIRSRKELADALHSNGLPIITPGGRDL